MQIWVNGDKTENIAKIADFLEGAIKMQDGGGALVAWTVGSRVYLFSARTERNELGENSDEGACLEHG